MPFSNHLPCSPFVQPEALPCCDGGYDIDEQEEAIELATELLWMFTARQFGVCTATVIPVLDCFWTDELELGLWPVNSIEEVREDGIILDPTKYYVDHYRRLVRTDGQFTPITSKLEIDLNYGMAPPALVRRATAKAACEFLKLWNNKPCGLPERITSVSRPGVSMQVASSEDLLSEGFTGIYEIDLAIKMYNPKGIQSAAMVWSPEIENRRRVVTS